MSENTPQNPYEPGAGGPTPPSGPAQPPAYGSGQPPAYGGGQPPAYGESGRPPAYGGPGDTYGTQAGAPFSVGEALGYGWRRFTGNWLFWVLFVLLTFVVGAIFNAPSFGDLQEINEAAMRGDISASTAAGASAGGSLLQLIGSLVTSVLSALGVNAALREVSGEKATWGSLFKVNSFGMVVLAALLLLAASFVGVLLCGVGLIAVAIFSVFTYHNVVDRNLNAWEAFTTSFRQVGQNFGAVFLLELAVLGINIVGTLVCLIGLLVTIPLTTIAVAYAFRRLTGGPVAA
ncbi:hypothetical protein ACFQHV_20120 [Promicromonospora thailandica]|uniref:Membrane protein n=1 Tax=Promicromonospora thailandica TaxID=765201 RepID=A0A9X2G2D5_9MICO|nr:hypothetical protein [Promicromonospora thailandica]MCP2264193.1 putative membrane protein [Promicromonospora thailandica]BFF21140.1 hypothetical protein GCM10025730_46610 [Promicromonospora thailandica]